MGFFYRGKFKEAAEAAAPLRANHPEDAEAALLMHIAAAHAGTKGTAALAEANAGLARTKWPYRLVEVFLGQRTADSALAMATVAGNAPPSAAQTCQAQFYLGQKSLIEGQAEAASAHFELARNYCPPATHESTAALINLGRLDARK